MLLPYTACDNNLVAIDPAGRFVVFVAHSSGCGLEVLWFQRLDPSRGTPVGASVELLSCDFYTLSVSSIDILREGNMDLYWLSFGTTGLVLPGVEKGKYIMQIDANGNVLRSPTMVAGHQDYGYPQVSASAISSRGANYLVLYIIGDKARVYRVLVNKNTLQPQSIVRTSLAASDPTHIQVADTGLVKFLTMNKPPQTLRAFELNSKGSFTGNTWRLSPRTDGGSGIGGVSRDGRMALSECTDQPGDYLYLQPLNHRGLPEGDPFVVARRDDIVGLDATSLLLSNRRLVGYLTTDGSVFVQRVDGITGERKGTAIPVFPQ